jgi:DNA-binding transcriptional regulator YdaS (Cro superfamily)
MLNVVKIAARNAGGVVKLAKALGCRHQAFYSWKKVPPGRVAAIARIAKVPRSEIRPDIFGRSSLSAACTPVADDTAAHGGAASPDPIPETSAPPPLDHVTGDRADASPGTAG